MRTAVLDQPFRRLSIEAGRIAGSCLVLAPPPILRAQYLQNVLYSFCPDGGTCVSGANPASAVIADPEGNLYGTPANGGAYGQSTVFELSPPSSLGSVDGKSALQPIPF
jgi:hypothetical protein